MRTVDLDNLDLASARRAIEKARKLKPWCTRDRKDPNVYRVRTKRTRRQIKNKKPARLSFVTFIFTRTLRMATCTCDGNYYGATKGLICFCIARAYFQHKKNVAKDAERDRKKAVAA